MIKWIGIVGFVMMGCSEYRDLAEESSNQGLSDERNEDEGASSEAALTLDVACESLEATKDDVHAQAEIDGDFGVANVLYKYYGAYCNEPTVDDGTIMHCSEVAALAPEECQENAAPFIDCLADNPTTDPATDCADVWVGDECSEDTSHVAVAYPDKTGVDGGLYQSCGEPSGSLEPGEGGTPDAYLAMLPAAEGTCEDGHTYAVRCETLWTCTAECTCSVDGTVIQTVTTPDWQLMLWGDMADRFEACGWVV